MIIYTAYTGYETGGHYATLREAEKDCRQAMRDLKYVNTIEIERCETVELTKANLITILNTNGGSWSASSTVVKTIRRKGA